MSLAYCDGTFVDSSKLMINPSDYGFARGVTAFELTRVYGGVPFRLEDHIERLLHGATMFGIQCPVTNHELMRIATQLTTQNKFPHSIVKFYLTAGECERPGSVAFADCDGFVPHLLAVEEEVNPQHPDAPKGLALYQKGISLKTVPFSRHMATVKSINYSAGYAAAREQIKQGWDEVLFTHPDGYVTEATTSNFFAVIDGKLSTPKEGMLYGITRKVLLELAAKNGITVVERHIMHTDLTQATEAFITGSFVEMVPVKKIDHHILATTMDGLIFKKLRQAFTNYIKEVTVPMAKAS